MCPLLQFLLLSSIISVQGEIRTCYASFRNGALTCHFEEAPFHLVNETWSFYGKSKNLYNVLEWDEKSLTDFPPVLDFNWNEILIESINEVTSRTITNSFSIKLQDNINNTTLVFKQNNFSTPINICKKESNNCRKIIGNDWLHIYDNSSSIKGANCLGMDLKNATISLKNVYLKNHTYKYYFPGDLKETNSYVTKNNLFECCFLSVLLPNLGNLIIYLNDKPFSIINLEPETWKNGFFCIDTPIQQLNITSLDQKSQKWGFLTFLLVSNKTSREFKFEEFGNSSLTCTDIKNESVLNITYKPCPLEDSVPSGEIICCQLTPCLNNTLTKENTKTLLIVFSGIGVLSLCALLAGCLILYQYFNKHRDINFTDTIPLTGFPSPKREFRKSEESIEDPRELYSYERPSRELSEYSIETSQFCAKIKDEFIHEDGNNLTKQFKLFKLSPLDPSKACSLPENEKKNKIPQVLPYEETRVILRRKKNEGNYINASYVKGLYSNEAYILAQNPGPDTVRDFWRMIRQERIGTIFFISSDFQINLMSCIKYWPDVGEPLNYGDIDVENIGEQEFETYTKTLIKYTGPNNIECSVNLYIFQAWARKSEEMHSHSFIEILREFNTNSESTPILLHCFTGSLRCGLFVLCNLAIKLAEAGKPINMPEILDRLRSSRMNVVEAEYQYKLAHLIVLEYLRNVNFELEGFDNVNYIKLIMQELEETKWIDYAIFPYLECKNYPDKNRYKNNFPGERRRVKLSTSKSDYINAVYVDGYRWRNKFITTQIPLETTIPDFWRMVIQAKSTLIVNLNPCEMHEKYWPRKGEIITKGNYSIEFVKKENLPNINLNTIAITHNDVLKRNIRLMDFKKWPSENLVTLPEDILHLYNEMNKLLNLNQGPPIIIVSDNGIQACGVFVALVNIMDKYKKENKFDLFTSVRSIRHSQNKFVTEKVEFEFLLKCVQKYKEKKNML